MCKTVASPVTCFHVQLVLTPREHGLNIFQSINPEKNVLTFGTSSVDTFFQRKTDQHDFYLCMNYFIE
jgi:hypothetical protein